MIPFSFLFLHNPFKGYQSSKSINLFSIFSLQKFPLGLMSGVRDVVEFMRRK